MSQEQPIIPASVDHPAPMPEGSIASLSRSYIPQKKPSPWLARLSPSPGSVESELTFSLFTLLEYLELHDVKRIRFDSNNYSVASTLSWNFTDGLLQIYDGYKTLTKEDHHGKKNKFVGVLNIAAGCQELFLSHTGMLRWIAGKLTTGYENIPPGITWSGWAFAAGMWADWLSSSLELCNTLKTHSISGWLSDKVDEANYLQDKIKEAAGEDTDKLKLRLDEILKDIQARCRTHYYLEKDGIADDRVQSEIMEQIKRLNVQEKSIYTQEPSSEDQQRDSDIQDQINVDCGYKFFNWTIKTAATTGMTIYAVNPEMVGLEGEAGLWLTYIAAMYCALKLVMTAGVVVKRYYDDIGAIPSPEEKNTEDVVDVVREKLPEQSLTKSEGPEERVIVVDSAGPEGRAIMVDNEGATPLSPSK